MADEAQRVWLAVQEALLKVRGTGTAVIAFDLDGTLVVDRPRTAYDPMNVPDIRPEIAAVALQLLLEGHTILVVTGRETEDEARRDTLRALTAAHGADLEAAMLRRIVISSGGRWIGTRTAVGRKVEALRHHGAALLVGDLVHLDGKAAREVGIPFVNVRRR